MKIYNWVVISILTGEILSEDSFEYQGEIVQCKGGGGTESKPLPLDPWMESGPYSWLKNYFGQINQQYNPMESLQGYLGGEQGSLDALQNELFGTGGDVASQEAILSNLKSPEMLQAAIRPYLTSAYQNIGQAGIPSSSYADKLISSAVTQGWLGNANQTLGGYNNLLTQKGTLAEKMSTLRSNIYSMKNQPVDWISGIQQGRMGQNITKTGSGGKGGFLGL